MIKEFREFAARGSMLDMAVGIILGAAFATIIRSLVVDIIMPPIGLLLGDVDFANLFVVLKHGAPGGPYASLSIAQEAGAVTMNYGMFINAVLIFIIVAFCLFLVIRQMNKMKKEEPAAEPTIKECPFCFTTIPISATRCPNCTSQLT